MLRKIVNHSTKTEFYPTHKKGKHTKKKTQKHLSKNEEAWIDGKEKKNLNKTLE